MSARHVVSRHVFRRNARAMKAHIERLQADADLFVPKIPGSRQALAELGVTTISKVTVDRRRVKGYWVVVAEG